MQALQINDVLEQIMGETMAKYTDKISFNIGLFNTSFYIII